MIGVNGNMVNVALGTIEKTYEEFIKRSNRLQPGFIDRVGITWFGQDAVLFMTQQVAPTFEELITNVNKTYQSIFDTIIQNARNFERKHQVTVLGQVSHSSLNIEYDYSIIRPDNNGFIGMSDIDQLKDACSYLRMYSRDVGMILDDARSAAKASGFYGENQQEKLNESMNKIKSTLSGKAEDIARYIEQRVNTVTVVEKEIARKNANTFS